MRKTLAFLMIAAAAAGLGGVQAATGDDPYLWLEDVSSPKALDWVHTWISEQIVQGYCGLHRQGYAHSSEVWLDGELVGGAYGVCIGHMFYGESMFARVSDASKIALAYLVHFLKKNGVTMIDCQQETSHLTSLGGRTISRRLVATYLERLIHSTDAPQGWPQGPLEILL